MNKRTYTNIQQTLPFKIQHIVEFLLYFFLLVGVMGLEITGTAMNNDELFDFYGRGRDIYLSNGRWGLALYRYVVDAGTAFWAAPLVASVFLALSWVIQLSVIRVNDWTAKIVYATVQIACISIFQFYNYAMQIDAMAFALLLCSLAFKFLCSSTFSLHRYFWSVLFLAVAIGIYQLNVLFYIIILFSFFVYELLIYKRSCLKNAILHILAPALGFALWLAIDMYAVTLADSGVRAFVEDYLKFYHNNNFSLNDSFIYLMRSTLHFLKAACIHSVSSFVSAATLIPFSWLIYDAYKKLNFRAYLVACALLGGIWFIPFCLYVLLRKDVVIDRVLFTQGISLACLWVLAWSTCPFVRIYGKFRMIACVLCSIILIKACYTYSQKEQEKMHLFSQNITTLKQIEQMRQNESLKLNRNVRVKLVSMYPGAKHPDRSAQLNTFIAYLGFDFVSESELSSSELDALQTMKGWPDVESVRAIDGYLLVRMDDVWSIKKRHFLPAKPVSDITR